MKRKLLVLLVMGIIGAVSFQIGKSRKNMDGYGYAAEWGCYQGAMKACGNFQTEQEQYVCQEEALDFCPKAGEVFKKFMEQGRGRVGNIY